MTYSITLWRSSRKVWDLIVEPGGEKFKKAYFNRFTPPMDTVWFNLFPPSPFVSKLFLFLPPCAFSPHCPHAYIPCSMPKKAGPWSLDKVKERLRQEQVEREKEASARYRQLEAKRAKEETVGGTSLSRCVLVVLVLFSVVLFVVVLALCAVILTLVKKENVERWGDEAIPGATK